MTYCNQSQEIIWGIGPQGYRCQNCDFDVHKKIVQQVSQGGSRLSSFQAGQDLKVSRLSCHIFHGCYGCNGCHGCQGCQVLSIMSRLSMINNVNTVNDQ